MAETETTEGAKRERSPSFPYLGLSKALERTETLYAKAKRYETRVADIAKDWGLAPTSSSTDRTVAALLSFGLIDYSGSKETRRIKVSDVGLRILDDPRPGVREKLLAEAALRPKIMGEYAALWAGGRPDDDHAIGHLKWDANFTDDGARMFLRVFDDTIRFTSAYTSDKVRETQDEPLEAVAAKLGDVVQWTSGGVDQLASPARVIGVSDDAQWLWVEGSQTGIPMSDVQIVEASEASKTAPPPPPSVAAVLGGHRSRPQPGMQIDAFSLDEGVVSIEYPEGLTIDSVAELEDFFALFIRKARRRATATLI